MAHVPFVDDFATSKRRPVLVIQNDVGNQFSPNVIVAAISSQIPRRAFPTTFLIDIDSIDGRSAGLARTSIVQTNVILTLPKSAIVQLLGRLPRRAMAQVDICIRVSLGLS